MNVIWENVHLNKLLQGVKNSNNTIHISIKITSFGAKLNPY